MDNVGKTTELYISSRLEKRNLEKSLKIARNNSDRHGGDYDGGGGEDNDCNGGDEDSSGNGDGDNTKMETRKSEESFYVLTRKPPRGGGGFRLYTCDSVGFGRSP